jgi:hypothetical protein
MAGKGFLITDALAASTSAVNRIRRLLTAFVVLGVVIGVMVGSALSVPAQADTVTRQLLLKITNI